MNPDLVFATGTRDNRAEGMPVGRMQGKETCLGPLGLIAFLGHPLLYENFTVGILAQKALPLLCKK